MTLNIPKLPDLSGVRSLLSGALSEPNGTGSFGRFAASFVVVNVIGWVWFLLLKTHVMPDLGGLTLFLATSVSATYGANRIATVLDKKVSTAIKDETKDDTER